MRTLCNELKKVRAFVAASLFFAVLNCFSDLLLPYMMQKLVDNGVMNSDRRYIIMMAALMAAVALCSVFIRYMKNFFTIKTAQGYAESMRWKLFEKVMSLMPGDVDSTGASTLITRQINDVSQVQAVLDSALRVMIRFPVNCIGGMAIMFILDWKTALIILAIVPVIAALSVWLTVKTMPMYKQVQAGIDKFNKAVRSKINGIRVIHAFNRIQDEQRRSEQINAELCGVNAKADRTIAALNPVSTFVMNLAVLAVVLTGIHRVLGGTMKIGVLMASVQYAGQILLYAVQTTVFLSRIPRAVVSAKRIEAVMKMTPSVQDAADAACGERLDSISFENVTFRYPGAEKPVLDNVSFTAQRGQVTAVVGSTGSGKTTIINLIERFCDPEEGAVRFNGTDIKTLKQDYVRSCLALSPQQTYIFGGTVASAVLDGDADASDSSIRNSLEDAQAWEFVQKMPGDIHGQISPGGSSLSGGQKQRLSIARAIVRKPDFYIFDDSFSALDYKTDAAVRRALRTRAGDSGVIMVAQRISTIKDADKIIVLDGGRVAAAGTHTELLESCGVYRELAASQKEAAE